MNNESTINVHYSSLVGLKAELLRKKNEVELLKANQQNVQYIIRKKKEKLDKKTIKKLKKEENKKRKEEEEELINVDPDIMKMHKKSKLMLEAKSRLYSQLSKTRTTINQNFLVDFENKQNESDDDDKCDNDDKNENNNSENYDSDGDWIEYTDCFGRSRKCLREDLPKMKQNDERLKKTISKSPTDDVKEQVQFFEDKEPAKEPTIEIMRRKWEEEMEKLANKSDIHYQDVLFDEARAHGVGYYAFSKDEEERAKQQESLNNLRKETERKQQENQRIREMKEKIQNNRLKAARMRRRIRAGLPPEDPEDKEKEEEEKTMNEVEQKEKEIEKETNGVDDNDDETKRKLARKRLEDIEKRVKGFEDVLGKRNKWYVMSQDEWVQKKRKERMNEFAPNYDNFERGETLNISGKNLTDLNESTDDVLDTIGPMPLYETEEDFIGPMPIDPVSFDENSQNSKGTY